MSPNRTTTVSKTELTSFRLPAEVAAALRKLSSETGETVSDLLRRGALTVLGICPTCGRGVEAPPAPAAMYLTPMGMQGPVPPPQLAPRQPPQTVPAPEERR